MPFTKNKRIPLKATQVSPLCSYPPPWPGHTWCVTAGTCPVLLLCSVLSACSAVPLYLHLWFLVTIAVSVFLPFGPAVIFSFMADPLILLSELWDTKPRSLLHFLSYLPPWVSVEISESINPCSDLFTEQPFGFFMVPPCSFQISFYISHFTPPHCPAVSLLLSLFWCSLTQPHFPCTSRRMRWSSSGIRIENAFQASLSLIFDFAFPVWLQVRGEPACVTTWQRLHPSDPSP